MINITRHLKRDNLPRLKRKHRTALFIFALAFTVYWFCLPRQLFDDPLSTVLEDKNGQLLGAKIASDGQWRFPPADQVPLKFEKCILHFEDRYFYYHPGFNPASLARALVQNLRSGEIVSGGSTITMQVIRLSRKGKRRSLFQKAIEIVLATRLEIRDSKKEILALYASNAPFGGNVVGLDAASWRYYQRPPDQLSWAETASLAVLPNAPSLIHPGKNRQLLMAKRNRLLKLLHDEGLLDAIDYELAMMEPLPEKPLPLPMEAPHLLSRIYLESPGQRVQTSIDPVLQTKLNGVIHRHYMMNRGNGIYNAAIIVAGVETGEVLAYIGNTSGKDKEDHSMDVDVITARRSSGSVLKPLLFATMLDHGEILPGTLVADIPTRIAGFSPENYSKTFEGAVPARDALSRSLNVPAVRMLRAHGLPRFHNFLQNAGFSTIDKSADHYGLTLILGGAEITLWDLAGVYASMARSLNHFSAHGSRYSGKDYHPLSIRQVKQPGIDFSAKDGLINAGPLYLTFKALLEVNRPGARAAWKNFSSSRKIAWKTGTSYGNRDAWAIGVTSTHVVGVWVGNADGEGRPGLTGLGYAAPLLFDVFDMLPSASWFSPPLEDLRQVEICTLSGHRASEECNSTKIDRIPKAGLNSPPCPYEMIVHLDKERLHRVNSGCYNMDDMVHENWFVLPPAMEWYYKTKNPGYNPLPPIKAECLDQEEVNNMEMIYPNPNARIYIPYELDGTRGKVIFEVAHRKSGVNVFWHVDDEYVGLTRGTHKMPLAPGNGKHLLTLVDEFGNTHSQYFEILDKEEKR